MEIARPYTAKTVCAAAGIEATSLRTWRNRGLMVGDKANEQDWTRYSLVDLMKVAVVAEFARCGVDLSIAATVVEPLGEIKDAAGFRPPLFLTASLSKLATLNESDPPEAKPKRRPKKTRPPSMAARPATEQPWEDIDESSGNWRRSYLADLTPRWTVNLASDDPEETIAVAVDVAKVFRRVESRLKEAT